MTYNCNNKYASVVMSSYLVISSLFFCWNERGKSINNVFHSISFSDGTHTIIQTRWTSSKSYCTQCATHLPKINRFVWGGITLRVNGRGSAPFKIDKPQVKMNHCHSNRWKENCLGVVCGFDVKKELNGALIIILYPTDLS